MASSERGNDIENTAINVDLLRHSEYDIEVSDNDEDAIAVVKDAHKLVIDPTYTGNSIEFKKSKNALLVIPVKDIEDMDIISNPQTPSSKDFYLKTIFNDNQQNRKSITFKVKNDKHVDAIKQQINLLKNAEIDPFIQKKIKAMLNPDLCNRCVKEKHTVEFRSTDKLCPNCFKEQYGKTLLQAKEVEYHGGHKDHPLGGILSKHSQSGKMYLTEDYVIFAKDDKEVSKRWETFIRLSSVILNLAIEQEQRQKYVRWEATNYNNFGFGCGFMRESKKSYRLVIPSIDINGIPQEPEFYIQDIRKWASELYKMSIKSKMNISQQTTSEKEILQTTVNCFNCGREFLIYELVICDHCITSFCDVCIRNHSAKPEIEYESKYMGGHKLYPKSLEVKVSLYADRIEIGALHIRMSYTSVTDIENADEKKVTAKRMLLVGLYSFAWKKKDVFTIIEYVDGLNQKQTLVFDFGKKIEEAQRKIYDRMLAFRFAREGLLQSQKLIDEDVKQQKLPQSQTIPIETPEDDLAATSPKPGELSNSGDDPLRILQIRFAKGEITKEEYEEMRKMLES